MKEMREFCARHSYIVSCKVHPLVLLALQHSHIATAPSFLNVWEVLVAAVYLHGGEQGIAWVADSAIDHLSCGMPVSF